MQNMSHRYFSLFYDQIVAIQKPDSKVVFYLRKTENRTNKSLTQLSYIDLSIGTIFCQKMLILCKKVLSLAKLRGF